MTSATPWIHVHADAGGDPQASIFGQVAEHLRYDLRKQTKCPEECPEAAVALHIELAFSDLHLDKAQNLWVFSAVCDWTAHVYCLGRGEQIGGKLGHGEEEGGCPRVYEVSGSGQGFASDPSGVTPAISLKAAAEEQAKTDAFDRIKKVYESLSCPAPCSIKSFWFHFDVAAVDDSGAPLAVLATWPFQARFFCDGADKHPEVSRAGGGGAGGSGESRGPRKAPPKKRPKASRTKKAGGGPKKRSRR